MPLRRRSVLIWSIALCAAIVVTLVAARRDAIACGFAESAGLEQIGPSILADEHSNSQQRAELVDLLEGSRQRIADIYGLPKANPLVISIRSRMADFWFGSNEYGSTIFAFNRACVVIGPKGHNLDVVSHELVHAEIFERVGAVRRFLYLPTWFDEGAAMQADKRDAYEMRNFAGKAAPEVTSLTYGWQFFKGPDETLKFHYALAKQEVAQWLSEAGGGKALYPMLDEIRRGSKFQKAYASARRPAH